MTRMTSMFPRLLGAALISATLLVSGCGSDKVTKTTTEQTTTSKPIYGGATTTTTTTERVTP
jgi:hypothetical protein